MESKWEKEKETLKQKILVDNLSYEQIGREYGCSGGNIKKVASRLDIPLPQRRKINPNETFNKETGKIFYCLNCGKELHLFGHATCKFCDNNCQQEYYYKKYIKDWLEGKESGVIGTDDISKRIKRYLFEKYNNSCQICGWNKVNPYTEKVPLQIHHIDGDCKNNRPENLQLLCPNCHSLTENFGSRNKNCTRIDKRIR